MCVCVCFAGHRGVCDFTLRTLEQRLSAFVYSVSSPCSKNKNENKYEQIFLMFKEKIHYSTEREL